MTEGDQNFCHFLGGWGGGEAKWSIPTQFTQLCKKMKSFSQNVSVVVANDRHSYQSSNDNVIAIQN